MLKMNCRLPRIMLRVNKVVYGKNLKLLGYPFIFRYPEASIYIGDNCQINSNFFSNLGGLFQRTIIIARGHGKIRIGNNVGISGSTIYSLDSIEIGDNTVIGANTKIIDSDIHPIDPIARLKDDASCVETAPVKIGDNVFIGTQCIILKGTELGENCVVGAGSVVHGKFIKNSIIAGNPAKFIKMIPGGDEEIE